MNFTDRQNEAIFTRNTDILVSAAAGSGKTSVLAERAAQLVLEGGDIRRMLICTFTNAAAAEMRERIISRLSALAEERGEERLYAQAEHAAFSDICTIHSFAQKVIRESTLFADSEKSPAGLRVLGQEEMNIIRMEAMEECMAEFYADEDANFIRLRSKYSGRDDRALSGLLFSLFDYVNSLPERMDWLKNAAEKGFDYKEIVAGERVTAAKRLAELYKECVRLDDEMGWVKQGENDSFELEEVKNFAKEAYDTEISRDFSEHFKVKRMTAKLEPEDAKEKLTKLRDEIKRTLSDIADYVPDDAELERENEYMKGETAAFYKVLCRFDEIYSEKKAVRRGMDFDDMMNFANDILKNEDAAKDYSGRYDHVFIDEYQDTNPIQEELLGRVSKDGGRFMVGDIKQSIYRFRLADPTIFSEKARLFAGEGEGSKLIRMNENFRSAPEVCAGVNHIMSRLMSREFGEIDYDEREALLPMRDTSGGVELMLTAGNSVEDEFASIARRILSLYGTEVNGRKLEWGDFCVLYRGGREIVVPEALRAFEKAGIPAIAESRTNGSSYMLIFINVLELCDGFYSDIALISVMRSHIGNFDEAELAQIRNTAPMESFCTAFKRYAAGRDTLAGKCAALLKKIESWRVHMQALSMADFLMYIKTETGFMAAVEARPDGAEASVKFAKFFSAMMDMTGTVKSIPELTDALNDIYKNTGGFPGSDKSSEKPDAVSVMTIHGSKGLQFPVVILACTDKGFNDEDLRKRVLWHRQMGMAFDFIDENAKVFSESTSKKIMASVKKNEARSEELRVLYVAMTRAENILIISGKADSREALTDRVLAVKDPYALMRCGDFLEWAVNGISDLECMGGDSDDADIKLSFMEPEPLEDRKTVIRKEINDVLRAASKVPAREFISYDAKEVPSWVGVSWLLPEYEPAEGDYSGEGIAEGTPKLKSTALGTLVHLFLQNAPFEIKTKAEIEAFADELYKKEIITEDELKALRRASGFILNFYTGEIMERIRAAKKVYRELPFCVAVDAKRLGYDAEGETTLVGGVIDLIFEEDDGLVIVDYKSNHASPDTIITLAEHYSKQMEMYSYAADEIWGKKVKEKYLFFLRPGILLRVE